MQICNKISGGQARLMNTLQFEGQKMALKQDSTGFVLTIRVHPDELPEDLFRDFVGARYGIAMVRIDDNETPFASRENSNRVKASGMLCKNHLFWDFLKHKTSNPVDTEIKAVNSLYSLLGITSRVELNGNMNARKQFDKLTEEYDDWSRKEVGF